MRGQVMNHEPKVAMTDGITGIGKVRRQARGCAPLPQIQALTHHACSTQAKASGGGPDGTCVVRDDTTISEDVPDWMKIQQASPRSCRARVEH